MEWTQVLVLFLANASLILWFRSESRSDWRHLDQKIDANHRETNAVIEAMRKETLSMIDSIRQEMRDFHGRLCAIEERRREK